ncbi:ATP-binding protein [Sphingomonas sp.]|uniref:ATP-binding protein n=1 Tax=Sphingomonas sp. TaxID=28214 RepID=UPI001B0A2911|nr:ATP-binding protein [Sphingomonas sp.]MBO9713884.1 ATP-binding protein [Sphingomonas sp.]
MSWPLLARAEAEVLAALESGTPCLADTIAMVGAAEEDAPERRLAETFVLSDGELGLVLLLATAAFSEPAARALEARGGAGGVPVWLARSLLPALALEQLSAQERLRRFELVEASGGDIAARLKLPAAIQDWLLGLPALDPRCRAWMAPVPVVPGLAEPQLTVALAARLRERSGALPPLVQAGSEEPGALAAALAALGLQPWLLRAADLPPEAEARDSLARAWSRDAALNRGALLLDAGGVAPALALGFAARVAGHVVLSGLEGTAASLRPLHPLAAPAPDRRKRWAQALGEPRATRLGAGLDRVARQFRLDGATIDALVASHGARIDAAEDPAELLWHAAARAEPARGLPGVALVEPSHRWDQLVLPPGIEAALHRLEAHVRHAGRVFDEWGFATGFGGRGRGVAALFAGPSGTGKTMAAEVLAHALDLRVLVIDLSQVISKFVGETSKNIAAAFDLAERSGAVMVWNEGDAIWGARGTVGQAVDRHINAEVGDLLQRIEAFEGFTVVTTNLRHAIDPAFLRRFRFVVDFPVPSAAERLRIWQRAFPAAAPLDEIDFGVLAQQPLTGAAIRNIALASAFQAAAGGGRIDRQLIAAELAAELRKSDPLVSVIDWGTAQ